MSKSNYQISLTYRELHSIADFLRVLKSETYRTHPLFKAASKCQLKLDEIEAARIRYQQSIELKSLTSEDI